MHTHTHTAKVYAGNEAGDPSLVTVTMTAAEAHSVLEALNEPSLKSRAFEGLSDWRFQQDLVEVSDALIEAGCVLPDHLADREENR